MSSLDWLRRLSGVLILASVVLVAGSHRAERAVADEAEEPPAEEEADPAEVAIGERLFLEPRFAQHFFALSGGDANAAVPADPVMDDTVTTNDPVPGPFAGLSMNCRACHLVDEHTGVPGAGNRTYSDFARRSPVPERLDGQPQRCATRHRSSTPRSPGAGSSCTSTASSRGSRTWWWRH